MGVITALFSRYPVYLEGIGFMAVFTEAMLGMPQFVRNFKNKSTEGMRLVVQYVVYSALIHTHYTPTHTVCLPFIILLWHLFHI